MCLKKVRFSKKGRKLYVMGVSVIFIAFATSWVPLIIWASARYEEFNPHFQSVFQQNEEWERSPFTDIQITPWEHEWWDCERQLGTGYEDMFVRKATILGKEFVMKNFGGKRICGKRGALNYLKASQPDLVTGLCPGVLIPCSNVTSIKNTYCYHPSQNRSEACPITFVDVQLK